MCALIGWLQRDDDDDVLVGVLAWSHRVLETSAASLHSLKTENFSYIHFTAMRTVTVKEFPYKLSKFSI